MSMEFILLTLLISSVTCFPSAKTSLCHFEDELACGDGTCIPVEWICDNVPDCSTREDESKCHYLHNCTAGTFMCRSGECIAKEKKCDNHSDCTDSSDERGCDEVKWAATSTSKPFTVDAAEADFGGIEADSHVVVADSDVSEADSGIAEADTDADDDDAPSCIIVIIIIGVTVLLAIMLLMVVRYRLQLTHRKKSLITIARVDNPSFSSLVNE